MQRIDRIAASAAVLVGLALLPPGANAQQRRTLGPADRLDLPALDTGRVTVGMIAPDFTLESKGGAPVTLSDFRAKKHVVLVFYRGHW
ncbi:MAG: redoxin domain-containing protein [Gemmatimonadaceae bacterium]